MLNSSVLIDGCRIITTNGLQTWWKYCYDQVMNAKKLTNLKGHRYINNKTEGGRKFGALCED